MYLLSSRIFEVTCCRNTPCLAFSFQNSHWIVSCWCVSKDFLGKCQRFWALGMNWATFFHFSVRPKRFFPDAACPASLPTLFFCESICLFLVVAFSRILVSTLAFARLKNLTRKVSFAHQQNG